MNQQQFEAFYSQFLDQMAAERAKKNTDYTADNDDPFHNFRAAALYGLCSAEIGVMTRLLDKVSRAATFLQNKELVVKDEKIYDTLRDLANYSIILAGLIKEREMGYANSRDA